MRFLLAWPEIRRHRGPVKPFVIATLCAALAVPLFAAGPYHLQLEANPSAPFPFLGKFGTVTIHVYGSGVRAETLWLNGFSRNGARTVTVENPLGRMYTDMPLAEISLLVRKLGGASLGPLSSPPERVAAPVAGKVRGLDATRYRLVYGPEAWIDVWTTRAMPDNPQFRAIVNEFVAGVSPGAAAVARNIPGTPIYVELNFRRFKKVPLVRLKSFSSNNEGERDALSVGMLYFRAPLLESIWK
jgi:hypothetical protein